MTGNASSKPKPRNHEAAHLALMTAKVAQMRRDAKTCSRGHEWTPENTYMTPSSGERRCRECQRLKTQERRRRETYRILHDA